MGCCCGSEVYICESEVYLDNKKYLEITPLLIPFPSTHDLYEEMIKIGIIFNYRYNILEYRSDKCIYKMADVILPKGFGILKINNTGYYLVDNKYTPCYYMWKKKQSESESIDYYIYGIKRISTDIITCKIDTTKYELYNGWWMLIDDIKHMREEEYSEKIENYKKHLDKYNKCSCYDSQVIQEKFSKITDEYNMLLLQVPTKNLLANNISQPPVMLKSLSESMFVPAIIPGT